VVSKDLICAVKFFDIEIGQFEIAQSCSRRSFVPVPCRQAFLVGRYAASKADVSGECRRLAARLPHGLKHYVALLTPST